MKKSENKFDNKNKMFNFAASFIKQIFYYLKYSN